MQCCVFGCEGDPGPGIQGFYNFPQDNHRKIEWMNAVGRLEEELNALSALCSNHFLEESFEFTPKGMLLKINAVPVMNTVKREVAISNTSGKLKRSVIIVSTATVRIEKKRRKIETDDLNQVEKQSELNIVEEIIKEHNNSELLKKQTLYILESKPDKIKEDLDVIRSHGYNIHLRGDSRTRRIKRPSFNYDDDTHFNEFDSDIDIKEDELKAEEGKRNGITDLLSPDTKITNIQSQSKNIIQSTLQTILDSETPEESFVLIENTKLIEPEKEKPATGDQPPKKRRRKKQKVIEYQPVSDTMEVHKLTLEQQLQRIKDALQTEEFLKHPHRCYKCGISFKLEFHYRQHMVRHDKSYGTFVCTVCNSYYPKRKVLSAHRLNKHYALFKCKLCPFQSSARADAKAHTCGTDEIKMYSCEICLVSFSKQKAYYTHKHKKHKLADFVCSLCGATFNNPKGLQTHHSICKRQVWECQLCLRKFRDQHELRLHQQSTVHACRKAEAAKAIPELDSYHCEKCSLPLPTRRAYLMHMSRKHPPDGIPQFRCDECNVNFKTKLTFDTHMKLAAKHRKPDAFRFQCEHCSAVFTRKIKLMEHLQIHTNEKMYKCTICEKSFTSGPGFWHHKQYSHGGGKPKIHPCTYCEKRFDSRNKLLVHIRSHTSEKPFVCDLCGNGFTSNCSLKQHVRGVHLKIWPKRVKSRRNDDAPARDAAAHDETDVAGDMTFQRYYASRVSTGAERSLYF